MKCQKEGCLSDIEISATSERWDATVTVYCKSCESVLCSMPPTKYGEVKEYQELSEVNFHNFGCAKGNLLSMIFGTDDDIELNLSFQEERRSHQQSKRKRWKVEVTKSEEYEPGAF